MIKYIFLTFTMRWITFRYLEKSSCVTRLQIKGNDIHSFDWPFIINQHIAIFPDDFQIYVNCMNQITVTGQLGHKYRSHSPKGHHSHFVGGFTKWSGQPILVMCLRLSQCLLVTLLTLNELLGSSFGLEQSALSDPNRPLSRHRRFLIPSDSGWTFKTAFSLVIPIQDVGSSLTLSIPFTFEFDSGA